MTSQVQLFYKFRNDEIFRRINVNNLVRITHRTKFKNVNYPMPGAIACGGHEVGIPVDSLQ